MVERENIRAWPWSRSVTRMPKMRILEDLTTRMDAQLTTRIPGCYVYFLGTVTKQPGRSGPGRKKKLYCHCTARYKQTSLGSSLRQKKDQGESKVRKPEGDHKVSTARLTKIVSATILIICGLWSFILTLYTVTFRSIWNSNPKVNLHQRLSQPGMEFCGYWVWALLVRQNHSSDAVEHGHTF